LRKLGGGVPAAGFLLCSLDTSGCSVIPQSGCKSGFSCYAVGTTQLECDCQGAVATGDSCTRTPLCQPGDICIGPAGAATCHQVCNMSNGNTDCPAGMTCGASGTPVGYCM
jgi:hypothetical protein